MGVLTVSKWESLTRTLSQSDGRGRLFHAHTLPAALGDQTLACDVLGCLPSQHLSGESEAEKL